MLWLICPAMTQWLATEGENLQRHCLMLESCSQVLYLVSCLKRLIAFLARLILASGGVSAGRLMPRPPSLTPGPVARGLAAGYGL